MGIFGFNFEQEEGVPASKKYMISTRDNSGYKWQHDPHILGALEVPCDPVLHLTGEYTTRHVVDRVEAFDKAIEVWEEMGLREEFIKAAQSVPSQTCCCGWIPDDDGTIKGLVPALNRHWVKEVNKKLMHDGKGFRIDVFLWQWHNATGKSETNIILIRFFEMIKVDGR